MRLCKYLLPALFFISCTDQTNRDTLHYQLISEDFIKSAKSANAQTQFTYNLLSKKTTESGTAYQASLWLPKADTIIRVSTNFYNYLDSLKAVIKERNKSSADVKAIKQIFIEEGNGERLFTRLAKFKEDVLAVDELVMRQFKDALVLSGRVTDTSLKNEVNEIFFKNRSSSFVNMTISRIQNNTMLSALKLVTFCNEQVSNNIFHFTSYSAIIGQNTTALKSGEYLEITAGVGAFSTKNSLVILVQNNNIPLSEDGAAYYKIRVLGKPGKYRIPVKISYTEEDGRVQNIQKNVEYTVIK